MAKPGTGRISSFLKEYRVIEEGDGIFTVESMLDIKADEEEGSG